MYLVLILRRCPPAPSSDSSSSQSQTYISEAFSPELVLLLSDLLQFSPERRLGYNGVAEVKNHSWLNSIDWTKASKLGLEPPFAPSKGEVHAADAVDIGW
jgi:hypothetical protein